MNMVIVVLVCDVDVVGVDCNDLRLLPCLSPLYENHSAVNDVDSALDSLASAVGKHQVVLKTCNILHFWG